MWLYFLVNTTQMEGTLGGREGVNDTEKVLDNTPQKNGHQWRQENWKYQ